MNGFKTQAYIQSLNTGKIKPEITDEITVLEKVGDNDYIVDYIKAAQLVYEIIKIINFKIQFKIITAI